MNVDWNQPIAAGSDECPVCGAAELNQPAHFTTARLNCTNCRWNGPINYTPE